MLDFPVVSGNVSLYNETDGVAIPPTPVCGGVGLIQDVAKTATLKGAQAGDVLILIGETIGHMGASLYAREILGLKGEALGPPPPIDLKVEKRNGDFVRKLIQDGLVNAVHDVSDGGIACAAAEMALASGVGLYVDQVAIQIGLPDTQDISFDVESLFGEGSGCYLVAVSSAQTENWPDGPNTMSIGAISGKAVEFIRGAGDSNPFLNLPLSPLREAHEGWLPRYMGKVD